MQSEEQYQGMLKISRIETKLNQAGCSNGHWVMVEDRNVEGGFRPVVTGCANQRRHGSAYCQECSDKYKNNEAKS